MQLRKFLIYIAFIFAVSLAFDPFTFSGAMSNYYPLTPGIKELPGTSVTNRLEPWETLPLARLAKWQKREQKKRVDAVDDRVRGMDQLHEQAAYKDAVAGFYYTLHLAPEKPAAYYYRATAKLTLGDTESTLGNIKQAQHLYRTAIQDYTHAISGTPGNINAYVFRSYAKFRLGILAAAGGNTEQAQHHYHAAIADCNQAIGLYQIEAEALKTALAVYTEFGEVMRDYSSAIEFREKYAFAYHLRGLEKQALGQHAAAATDLQKAKVLQRMPEYRGPFAPNLGRRSDW